MTKKPSDNIGRRRFLKLGAKAIPALAVMGLALTGIPEPAHADCGSTCVGGCYETCVGGCGNTCVGGCSETCVGGCRETCVGGCRETCVGGCGNTCVGSSR